MTEPGTTPPHAIAMPASAICLGCGYGLIQLTERRCPECGRGFDPDDDATYRCPVRRGKGWHWWSRGPGWVVGAGVLLTTLVVLWAESVPGGYFGGQLLGFFLVCVFGGLWGLRVLIAVIALVMAKRFRAVAGQYWKRWAVSALIALVGMVLVWVSAPQRVRFALARPGMEAAAQNILAGQPQATPFTAGGTSISDAYLVGQSGVVLIVEDSGFLNRGAWAYLPDPADQPAQLGAQVDRVFIGPALGGGWYRASEDW